MLEKQKTAAVISIILMISQFLLCTHSALRAQTQPKLEAQKVPIINVDGLQFKDLNKNGVLDKYEDWRLPIDKRIDDLLSKMTLEEKAGLMVHASIQGFVGPNGIVLDAPAAGQAALPGASPNRPSPETLILDRNVRWINSRSGDPPDVAARFSNHLQEIAESSRLGIPVVLSSDPRNSPARPGALAQVVPIFSQWPEQLGLGAIGDPKVVEEFGRIAREEYKAIGLRVTLSPQADVATEPRWSRIGGTFGEDAELDAKLTAAYVRGFQGDHLDHESVMTVTKHFPGDGPVKDGFDPHNAYGRFQVYPGNNFAYHLIPFRSAIAAQSGGIMTGYAIPVGIDTVAMSFSRKIVHDLLRETLGFDGLVVTDWLKNMPWGVENLSESDRQLLMMQAGVDQIGGEDDPSLILSLVRSGKITESRLDESVRRILKPMFEMGLFEDSFVDPNKALRIVAQPQFVAAGLAAQRHSIVLLKNEGNLLPAKPGIQIYAENFNNQIVEQYGSVVSDPTKADIILYKATAPYALHPTTEGVFAKGVHEGTLAYAGAANASQLTDIERLAKTGKPVVVCMYMDRPPIVTEFLGDVRALMLHFSSSDSALLDVIFGKDSPEGKLPVAIPRDMRSVENQKEDVPFDLANPAFPVGFGLTYSKVSAN